uniref:Agenet domain-containing protein n=1 Tax=Kalanchoe fedtschenkoi TaxID=63787 RepID=A0A7N0VI32_KALFE
MSTTEHLSEAGVVESMSVDSVAPPVSEDALNEGASVSVSTIILDNSPNGQCDQSSQDVDVITKKEMKLEAESREGNNRLEEIVSSDEKPPYFAPENPLSDDIVIEAQPDTLSEPATVLPESGIVAEVADPNNPEKSDRNVIYNSEEPSFRVSSSIVRQSSGDLKGQEVADASGNLSPVEANTAVGDAITEVVAAPSEPNVLKGGDAAAGYEIVKETPMFGTKQDEQPVLADGDRSTECGEPLSISPTCVETSEKEIQHDEVRRPDSNISSSEAVDLLKDKESSYVQDLDTANISKKDDGFSFDLPNTSYKDINKVWEPFSIPQTSTVSGNVEGSPVASSTVPKNKKRSQKISQGVTESSEPKRRRSTARRGGKKGDPPDETTILKQLERQERPANSLIHVGSSLSNFDFSTSLPPAFQQPFTDLQQLQLRAQIFVYGSLIQGTAPDEACLLSAFGGPDGGRSIWEKPWRKCFERIHNQILQTNMKGPTLQSSGNYSTPDQTSKRSAVGLKSNASPLGSAVKSDSSHAANPMIPLSSPLWNMHTSAPDSLQVSGIPQSLVVDHNPLPPLHFLQTPSKNIGDGTSWSAHASLPLPWVASAQTSAWNPNIPLSALPHMEPVKLIPMKNSALITYSTANHSSADLSLSKMAVSAISSDVVGANPSLKSLGQSADDPNLKKRKKTSISGDPRKVLEPAPNLSESVMANPSNSIQPASVKVTPLPAANLLTSSTTLLPSACPVLVGNKDADRNDMPTEDPLHRVNEAKLHAEEAAACAEEAVSHSQHVWDQLDKQKNSGRTVDLESKVASAAAAIAAAASVAKAAAAAAKLASDAALQAKLMADEFLVSSEYIKLGPGNGVQLSDGTNLVGKVTPASILKGDNRANSSSSIIGAAKEAARRKIESALAASKHAENLDAIVKAAELAAEAVALAGRVVALGDPLPLNALVESGPEGNWRLSRGPAEQLVVSNSVKEVSFNNELNDGKISPCGRSDSRASQHTKPENPPAPGFVSLETLVDQNTVVGQYASIANEALTASAVGPPELISKMESSSSLSHQEFEKAVETSADNHMQEGSIVEVFKEWGTVKAAWFAARVLDLKHEEVYVNYIEKKSGDGQYKEWITLSCEDNTAPIVRIAHPMTAIPSDGARKRRRTTIRSRSWEVGDKVDAWMQDCWWEGIVIEKNSKDESSLTVQFPAQGETCVVKAWNLRPSLIWKDGAWVEWSNPNESVWSRHETETPSGKRQKLSGPQLDVKGKSKTEESSGNVSLGVHDHSRLMGLSEDEKTFNVGKSTRDEGKVNAQRMVRTGLQKEGSKIIFGVPKPGKKKKFMDVSKHFDAGAKAKVIESNEPQKTSRLPISRGPHGWKNSNSRTEPQQKMVSKFRPKVLKSAKPLSASSKSSIIQKVTPATSGAASQIDEDRAKVHTAGDGSASVTERQAEPESCSDADGAIDGSILISSLARPPGHPSSKKPALVNMRSETSGVKHGLSHAKIDDVEVEKILSGATHKKDPNGAEPRRSNRRIQPTSRLLEGLQTSLSVAKIPSTLDRSIKSHNKNTSLKG